MSNFKTPIRLKQSKKILFMGLHMWTHLLRGPAQRQAETAALNRVSVQRLKVKEAHLLILKHWPEEEQASNLTQTLKSLLKYLCV